MRHRGRGPGEILAVNPHFNFWAVITHRRTKLSGPYLNFLCTKLVIFFRVGFPGLRQFLTCPFLAFQVGALQACVLAKQGYEVHLYEGRDGKPA